MRPPTKLGKHQENPISAHCLDRISNLPDELLGHMLSFLPTRCAVSTSILSTRWRYLFTLTSCLSFDDAACFDHLENNERIESTQRFKDFVNKVLELHQVSPIKNFSLVCKGTYDASDFDRWLWNALQKDVQVLHYELADHMGCLPDYDGLFMCDTLLNLKFIDSGWYYIKIPLSASLPKLKILHLERIVFFDSNSMKRLLSSCELLEELTLKYCNYETEGHAIYRTELLKMLTIEHCYFSLGTFEIDASNLEYLAYSSNIGLNIVPSWKYTRSLVRAELIFKCSAYDDLDVDEVTVEYESELLKAAAYKATELCFETTDSVQILLELDYDEQIPDFPSLSKLHVADCGYDAWESVTTLLAKSPQLETVIFKTGFHCCHCLNDNYPDYCEYDTVSLSDIPLDPFSCHVQVIEVREFCGHDGPLSLMGHLLRNASVLKRLVVFPSYDLDWEDELKMSKDLLMLPRASRDCCVEMN